MPTRLYAGVSHATSDAAAGVYATRDSGATWVKQLGCPGGALPANVAGRTIRLAVSGNRIYASFKTRDAFVVYRTTDVACLVGGVPERTWQKGWTVGSDIAPTLWSFLYAHPENADIVYATGTNFWRSTNGGASFSIMSGPHVDHHAFAVDPSDGDVVYTGCDGGIYRSNRRGASGSWSFVGEGMTNTEFYDIGEARTDPGLVIGGTQDNGTLKKRANGTVWDEIKGGDGATVDVDPTDAHHSLRDGPVRLEHRTPERLWWIPEPRGRSPGGLDVLQSPLPGASGDSDNTPGVLRLAMAHVDERTAGGLADDPAGAGITAASRKRHPLGSGRSRGCLLRRD